MRAEIKCSGEIYEAKYVSDMTEQEKIDSGCDETFESNDIFLEPDSWGEDSNGAWRYMTPEEIEIVNDTP